MTPHDADHLDDALEGRLSAMPAELRALVDIAGEVTVALSSWRLSPEERDVLLARVLELVDEHAQPLWRRLALQPRVPAMIGGAAMAAAAAVAIAVALSRGRKQHHAVLGGAVAA